MIQKYIKTNKKEGYSKSFSITLIMLPSIISIIILLVGNNVARAFSLAGAFSIIRFRSAPGKPKDISYVFFTLAVGLSAGMGYLLYAAIFTVVLCAVMIIVETINFGGKNTKATVTIAKVTYVKNKNGKFSANATDTATSNMILQKDIVNTISKDINYLE